MEVTVNFNFCDWLCGRGVLLVPHIAPIVEQPSPADPTPQHRGFLRGARLMATFSMSDSQQTTLTLTATDKKGNPASLPSGSIQWLVDQTSLLALTPSADGQSCLCASVGPLGTATVSVKVVDPTGTTLAAGSLDVIITGGAASQIVINPSAPVEQP